MSSGVISNVAVKVADAVKAALLTHDLPADSEVLRAYRPRRELKQLQDLVITVVPRSVEYRVLNRSQMLAEAEIDIGIQKKLTSETNDEIDPLMDFVQSLIDFLAMSPLAAMPEARWSGTSNEPIYDPQHMDEMRVFTSRVTMNYQVPV